MEFVQSFQNVNLLRRPFQGGKQLVWDGTGDSDRNGVANTFWTEIALSTNGRTLVPPRFNAESFQDRVGYYNANFPAVATRDEIIVSDINDYTSYDPTWATNRINTAESDFITRVFGYFRRSIVVFKSQSIRQAILQPTVRCRS